MAPPSPLLRGVSLEQEAQSRLPSLLCFLDTVDSCQPGRLLRGDPEPGRGGAQSEPAGTRTPPWARAQARSPTCPPLFQLIWKR